MHCLLRGPDGLADLLSEFDCADAARVVDYIAGHLRTATQVDAPAVIDQLALFCADDDRHEQLSMRKLSRSVAEFVANCMQFVAEDDTEFIVIEFVSIVPLVYGFDFLCEVGAAHGLVRARLGREFCRARRYLADGKAVEHAITIWRQRAMRGIASGIFDGGRRSVRASRWSRVPRYRCH